MFVQKINGEGGEDGISKAHAPSGAQTLGAKWMALKHLRRPHFPMGGLPLLFPQHTPSSYHKVQLTHLTDGKTEGQRAA